MSYHERQTGTMTEIIMPEGLDRGDMMSRNNYLSAVTGYKFEEVFDDGSFLIKSRSNTVRYTGLLCLDDDRWFRLKTRQRVMDRHADEINVFKRVHHIPHTFEFDVSWWNGGAGFDEVLTENLRRCEKFYNEKINRTFHTNSLTGS